MIAGGNYMRIFLSRLAKSLGRANCAIVADHARKIGLSRD
jgi:hypothetical protein